MEVPSPLIQVVAAVMPGDAADEVYAFRRAPDEREAGRWEFPGGKIEPNERPEVALRREIREELGLDVEVCERLWSGSSGRIRVTFYRVVRGEQRPALSVHDAVTSVSIHAPPPLAWASVDRDFVPHLARLWKPPQRGR